MKKYLKYFFSFLYLFLVFSCFKETPVRVSADFEIEVLDEDYSVPVTIRVINKTIGADLYEWSFEGAEQVKSHKPHPDEVVYKTPGKYVLRLEAWNTTERKVKELAVELDSAIYAGFSYQVTLNHFSPVEVTWNNLSYGGDRYYWEFSGGHPATYEGKTPPRVIFTEAGLHKVRLQVSNLRESTEFADTIQVLPPLSVDFKWQPGEGDYDMEAPLVAELSADCISALSYLWSVEGGKIENDTLADTRVRFENPGVYRIELTAANGKETRKSAKEIEVRANSNLYVLADLKFGITTALNTIGGYYSSRTGKVLKTVELTPENGREVDFVFWGLAGFDQCCFLSPDSAGVKALSDIPGARHTWIMNNPDLFTTGGFDEMVNDSLLKHLPIRENSDKNVNSYFYGNDVPHLVLFETADHRKGAVKIKKFVLAGDDSYILADVKIQKESS